MSWEGTNDRRGGKVVGIEFDGGGAWVGCLDEAGTLTVLDARTWRALKTLAGNAVGTGVRCKGLSMDETSRTLGAVYNDGMVRMWNTSTPRGSPWAYREVNTGIKAECITHCTISGVRSRAASDGRKGEPPKTK
jgi:hypothetical protein